MNDALIRRAAALPARQLHMLGIGVLLILVFALWSYGLRAPLAELRTVRAEQMRLAALGGDARTPAAQLVVLADETRTLAAQLGAGNALTPSQQLVELIGDLGKLAQAHGVSLRMATPAPQEPVMSLLQGGVDADVSGSYAALVGWMSAVEAARPHLSVASFEMHPAKTPGQIDMKIRIAAYRPQEASP
jgi:Tfp pilus assembly protein PilO